MEFKMETSLPRSPERLWGVMVDIERIASCIPGCEQVEEIEKLKSYKAVLKQKIGPFKLEVPAEIVVDEFDEPNLVRARAIGKDKFTGTTLTVTFNVTLQPEGEQRSKFGIDADLQVAGRLASLGHSIIKKKADENFAKFGEQLKAELEKV